MPVTGTAVRLVPLTPGIATVITAVVSSVKVSVAGADTLPATSVWRTWIVFAPSTATGAVVLQFTPSVLYSTSAPGSVPLTV